MKIEPGVKLGPYEIIEPIGAGGMGEVYKAKDTRLDRIVAVKVLPENTANNPDIRARFEREAKVISSLNHPNICTLYDIGEINGNSYLVMEYLEGETLSERMKKSPLEIAQVLDIAVQIADALDKAHRKGLIHRDLKPANVMLTSEGAKLLDFGLAKFQVVDGKIDGVSAITQTTPLTGTGTILGTLHYMAPEQLEGNEADARSDIFGFGAMLYEMVTNQKPFDGKSQAGLIAAIIEREPPSIVQLKPMAPPGLNRLIQKCLAKDPDNRWQSVRDMSDEIRWISQSGSQAGIPLTLSKRRKSRERLAWLIAGTFFAIVSIFTAIHLMTLEEPPGVVRSHILAPDGHSYAMEYGGHVAFSPDGSKIAFVARDTANVTFSLWVRSINSTVAVPLPNTTDPTYPFWSHDSRYVAFFADGKMKKILSTGGPVLTICDAPTGRGGTWNENDLIIFSPIYNGPLNKVAAAGGESVQITFLDSTQSEICHRWPQFLPDNDHFLFFNRKGFGTATENNSICIGSLSDSTFTELFKANSNPIFANGHLLYMRESLLMAQAFDPSGLKIISDAVPIAENVAYSSRFSKGIFTASNNGNLLFQTGNVVTGSRLLVYNRNGEVIDSIGEPSIQNSMELSPDQNSLLVNLIDPNTNESSLWIHDLNRKIVTRFTFDNEVSAEWNHDGQYVYYKKTENNNRIIMKKNINGITDPDTIATFSSEMWLMDVSSDGKYLVACEQVDNSNFNIKIIPDDNFEQSYLFIDKSNHYFWPKISPDGRWIAYTSTESGEEQLYVATFPKYKGKWQISTDGGDRPRWNKNGKELIYLDNKEHLKSAKVDGSGQTFKVGEITTLFEINAYRPGNIYTVYDDCQKIIVNSFKETKSVNYATFVQNWYKDLEK